MIHIPIKKLKNGMITAQSIYNPLGASYLTKGMELSPTYIERLEKAGFDGVTVTSLDPKLKLAPPDDIVQEKTRISAIQNVATAFHSVEENGTFDPAPLQGISENILQDIIAQQKNLVQLTDIRLHDTYTFAHSVNVAILSSLLGVLLKLSREEQLKLTLGGLLHDIGKITVPYEILTKAGHLTDDEWSVMQGHPEAGRQRLKKMFPNDTLLSTIALQHHEHIDGSGYPNHLKGEQIHRYGRIVAIADVYDALTSVRPYKRAYTPSVAHRLMATCSPGHFDLDLLKLFFDNVAIYPVGTILKTQDGYAIVKKVEFGYTLTPVVCVFANREGKLLNAPSDLDLKEAPKGMLDGVISDSELYHFIHNINVDPAIFLQENTEKEDASQENTE
ncbi:MAG: HD-GYP domain-containing protein [Selenomonas sp.]|uniref:HD-GYP domain-containing protein n=1 Tax=Selenomonas sputigena TaxID=69823 RepID=UPI0022341BE5|nr:HD-GYP domain-containing protein [Selenomonas sputigena]UZE45375.1 HD-GYP domain-containing protein [Selenomonas sputigena]